MLSFVIWLFSIRQCAYMGSRRVIGTFDGLLLGVFFSYFGILLILLSRKIIDNKNTVLKM
ncbi:MAG: hypothetical protein JWP78_3694 [Mucilaginibacter sp.]|nr:hypothetical protein [Mucilaginibacter sp.]